MFRVQILVLFATILLCGCDANNQVGPGTTFDAPPPYSNSAISMLPAPTEWQQVQNIGGVVCVPATAITLYRIITQKDYDLGKAAGEMKVTANGTDLLTFINWMNDHEMEASMSLVPREWAIYMITEQIEAGYYVVPHVNERARPNSPHVFIVYGVDGDRVLISDSNKHLGMNKIAVDTNVFRDSWLIGANSQDPRGALLMFVDSKPKQAAPPAPSKQSTEVGAETLPSDDFMVQ